MRRGWTLDRRDRHRGGRRNRWPARQLLREILRRAGHHRGRRGRRRPGHRERGAHRDARSSRAPASCRDWGADRRILRGLRGRRDARRAHRCADRPAVRTGPRPAVHVRRRDADLGVDRRFHPAGACPGWTRTGCCRAADPPDAARGAAQTPIGVLPDAERLPGARARCGSRGGRAAPCAAGRRGDPVRDGTDAVRVTAPGARRDREAHGAGVRRRPGTGRLVCPGVRCDARRRARSSHRKPRRPTGGRPARSVSSEGRAGSAPCRGRHGRSRLAPTDVRRPSSSRRPRCLPCGARRSGSAP